MKIENLPILSNLHSDFFTTIKQKGKIKEFIKGSYPLTSEDTLKYFYIILEGRLKISQINPQNAKEQTIDILTTGDMFDIIPLLDNKPHDVLTFALDNCKVFEIEIDTIRDLIYTNPEFNKLFLPYIAKNLRHLENLAVELSLFDTSTRLIRLFLKNLDFKNSNKLKLINDLPHEEIASLIGTVRHVVNRHIQQLKKEGILQVERKKLILKNIDALLNKLQLK
ncbi:Crp/Fnr family transcriptional regulator [Nitrosophilus kaiyonis]|uniref:Crp/Fnr family transcriptional regulator n=1 Tax=Nitrosophilus kaiyonis TaxID=2930200 RepID=UPI002492C8A7|nr:Crp/Fnr family transcriptional regulator [Nitrosophilus kaiyonis]